MSQSNLINEISMNLGFVHGLTIACVVLNNSSVSSAHVERFIKSSPNETNESEIRVTSDFKSRLNFFVFKFRVQDTTEIVDSNKGLLVGIVHDCNFFVTVGKDNLVSLKSRYLYFFDKSIISDRVDLEADSSRSSD